MRTSGRWVEWVWAAGLAVIGAVVALAAPVGTTRKNFFHPGTQPGGIEEELISPQQCSFCHGSYDADAAPFDRWAHSIKAQSGRDPVFHAALAIAEQDANFVADFCLRCHVPQTWVQNFVTFNTDPASPRFGFHNPLSGAQLEGVTCSTCHRMVDPIYTAGQSPSVDLAILDSIVPSPMTNPHNAGYVIDPEDRRRGPFDLNADWQAAFGYGFPGFHRWLESPFHMESRMCATCHDVSTPHFTKQPDGSFALNELNVAPNPDKNAQFPEQRTYSEWAASLFGQGPVDLDMRFGNRESVSSCQDCHMPKTVGQGCALEPPVRNNLPQHDFNGANTWVLKAVRALYPDSETGMSESGVEEGLARVRSMLARASDMELSLLSGDRLNVRIINYTGHKLPTGYTEGRRMWINVKFKDGSGNVVAERGAYDLATAELVENDTKVYEGKIGLDAAIAAATGNQAGPAFRLALSNKWFKDNRIPPMGFTNAAFESAGAGHYPPGQYADGQYWDDTPYAVPAGARSAEVTVYYQTTSKEYIEFLRDENETDERGQVAYDQWVQHGKSEPVEMDRATIIIPCACDASGDGAVSVQDLFDFLSWWFALSTRADYNRDGTVNVPDIFEFLGCWFAGCL